jgi:hypothetical protein
MSHRWWEYSGLTGVWELAWKLLYKITPWKIHQKRKSHNGMDLKSVLLSKAVVISLIIACLFVSSVYFVGRWYFGINSSVVTDSEHEDVV